MLENLSIVLMGFSAFVAFLTFLGAHSSALGIPNISKAGCFFAFGLLSIGMASGMYSPVAKYNSCVDVCAEAVEDLDADYGESEVFVSPARVTYHACRKGAVEAHEKAQAVIKELGGNVADAEMDTDEIVHSRCASQGAEACVMICFEGPPEA